jgi:hypothetical protein
MSLKTEEKWRKEVQMENLFAEKFPLFLSEQVNNVTEIDILPLSTDY